MKNIATADLLEQLKADTRQIVLETKMLLYKDPEILLENPAAGKWSVVQIVEHLNTYGRYYLPHIHQSLRKHSFQPAPTYNAGWLGNYFTNSMKPTPEKKIRNKMKALKGHIPPAGLDSKTVLEEFLTQQQTLLQLLEQAALNNIARIRIPISISKLVRLKLGDTFRFLIAHHQRHFVQIENTLKEMRTLKSEEMTQSLTPP
jgi:hypothetical protein